MESPGKYLKRERESRNLTLREVSASTRIKEHFLGAIEEDRYDLCPPPFYVKGFLANYARYLGTDPQDVILKYQEFVKPPPPPPEAVLQEKPKETFLFESRVQARTAYRVLLVSALLVSLLLPLYFLYTFQTGKGLSRGPLTQTKPETYEVASRNGSPTTPSHETVILEVAPEKENQPVLHQIKQLELIGPKEVQAESFPRVLEAHLGTGIDMESGRPMIVGKGSEFKCENQRVYFFSRVMALREGKISHVWRWEGEEFHRIDMVVKPPAWSVYSYITLPPARYGNWNVEVWDGDKILTHSSFKAH
jgi:cytoskeletal protein RodZ